MIFDFFKDVKTLDELRKEYRRLAFIYHPDKGGVTEIMQIINNLYETLSKKLINANPDFSESRKENEYRASQEIMQIIDRIIFLKGVEIEIIGSWIWVTGNTFIHRETLKSTGFKYSHQKMAWYWHSGDYSRKNGTTKSIEEIRQLWGSQKIQSKAEENQLS